MLEMFKNNFPAGRNYLVPDIDGAIDRLMIKELFSGTEKSRRHNLWGSEAGRVTASGAQIGWVPESMPVIFFTDSVKQEIANGFAAARGRSRPTDNDLQNSISLLKAVRLPNLAEQMPFLLSDGEMKIVWLLCQLAKGPKYLIAQNLPAGLSNQRLEILSEFLKKIKHILKPCGYEPPVIILGFQPVNAAWTAEFLDDPVWVKSSIEFGSLQ